MDRIVISVQYTNITSLWCTPHRDVIFVLLYQTKYESQKGEKLQTPEILDKYSSSAVLN